jgi:hypothetical protein
MSSWVTLLKGLINFSIFHIASTGGVIAVVISIAVLFILSVYENVLWLWEYRSRNVDRYSYFEAPAPRMRKSDFWNAVRLYLCVYVCMGVRLDGCTEFIYIRYLTVHSLQLGAQ